MCGMSSYREEKRLPMDNEQVILDGKTYKELLIAKEWYDAYMQNIIPKSKNHRDWIYTNNSYSTQAFNSEDKYWSDKYDNE